MAHPAAILPTQDLYLYLGALRSTGAFCRYIFDGLRPAGDVRRTPDVGAGDIQPGRKNRGAPHRRSSFPERWAAGSHGHAWLVSGSWLVVYCFDGLRPVRGVRWCAQMQQPDPRGGKYRAARRLMG
ncbi:hypothetical protein BD779DRAFT_618688 [Infundibulicybe gibba]|nr:hypothetical protein BD779DRAFT_618688 [Infundibulicybe gibba]